MTDTDQMSCILDEGRAVVDAQGRPGMLREAHFDTARRFASESFGAGA